MNKAGLTITDVMKWIDNICPGCGESMDPDEVSGLRRHVCPSSEVHAAIAMNLDPHEGAVFSGDDETGLDGPW